MTATPGLIALCEQLGRHWSLRSAIGSLAFIEAADDAPGAIYAAPLPELASRAATACSLTPGPSTSEGGSSPVIVLTIIAEAHAPTLREAVGLLLDLRDVVRPGGLPMVEQGVQRILGAPTLAAGGTAAAWRIIDAEIVSEPQPTPAPAGASPASTPDGQASATMTIVVRALAATVATAFTIHQTDYAPASVEVADGDIVFRWTDGAMATHEVAVPMTSSIGTLLSTIGGALSAYLGWEIDDQAGAGVLALDASDRILAIPETGCAGEADKVSILALTA